MSENKKKYAYWMKPSMVEEITKMLDEANAMTELNTDTEAANINNLAAKYETTTVDTAVEDELAALKASMGK